MKMIGKNMLMFHTHTMMDTIIGRSAYKILGSPLFFINQPTDDPDIDGVFGLALDFSKHAGGSETAGRHSKQHLTIMSFW